MAAVQGIWGRQFVEMGLEFKGSSLDGRTLAGALILSAILRGRRLRTDHPCGATLCSADP